MYPQSLGYCLEYCFGQFEYAIANAIVRFKGIKSLILFSPLFELCISVLRKKIFHYNHALR